MIHQSMIFILSCLGLISNYPTDSEKLEAEVEEALVEAGSLYHLFSSRIRKLASAFKNKIVRLFTINLMQTYFIFGKERKGKL
jgi:hypothetical protein